MMSTARSHARRAGEEEKRDRREEAGGTRAPFYVIGHRGSPCYEVENTMPSFVRALEQDGANGLELDLCITLDGIVVVWHDWDPDEDICLARCSGLEPYVKFCPRVADDARYRKPVNRLTFHEFIDNFGYGEKDADCSRVDACIPSFDEFIEWAAGMPQLEILFLDIKIPEDEPYEVPRLMGFVQEAIARHRPRFKIVYETRYETVLEAMKRFDPQAAYSLDRGPIPGIILRPSRFGAISSAIRYGNTFATVEQPNKMTLAPWNIYKRVVRHDMKLLRRYNRSGAATPIEGLICYTVDNEEQMRALIEMGVAGIQTDKPDVLTALVKSMRAMPGEGGERLRYASEGMSGRGVAAMSLNATRKNDASF